LLKKGTGASWQTRILDETERSLGASPLFQQADKVRGLSVRRGLSLVELMASLVITLIVMAATVQLFGTVTNAINFGRAGLETNDRVRSMAQRLRKDINGLTCDTIPWQKPEAASGYLEIVKGPSRDSQPTGANLTTPGATLLGYTQDVLFLTSRSKDLPFVGRTNLGGTSSTIESQVAEIVWFMSQSLNSQGQPTVPPTYTLYRRVFLVRPDVNPSSQAASTYFDNNDISAHVDSTTRMVGNSLADLCYRENRYGHQSNAPFLISTSALVPFPTGDQRFGEDVVLTNVLSFDIKVWDPLVPLRYDSHATTTVPGTPLVPSDYGYSGGAGFNPPIYGAYVDLNFTLNGTINGAANSTYFSGPYAGQPQGNLFGQGQSSGLSATQTGGYATYDLWPAGYEYYTVGLPNPNTNGQGVNGFADNNNGVDNPTERNTSPPYPVPLRGIQIKIRVWEPTTQQVREVTVAETFLPD
jgi:hypothetical protein